MFLPFCASANSKDYKQVVQNPYGFKRSPCPIGNCDTNLFLLKFSLSLQSKKFNDATARLEEHRMKTNTSTRFIGDFQGSKTSIESNDFQATQFMT